MALHDTDGLIVETGPDLTPSLPDPASVPGRSHDLTNTASSSAVWGSVGALPFSVDGVGLATLTVPRGSSLRVQSDGTRWVHIRQSGSRASFAGTAVTDAGGNAVFTFPAGLFPVAPVAEASVQAAASSNPIDYRVTALSATGATVHVRQSPTLVVLSLSVLGVSAPLAGVTVHLAATPPGTAS